MKPKMESKKNHNMFRVFCLILLSSFPGFLPAQEDSSKKEEHQSLIYLTFHVKDNHLPYLEIQTKNKVDRAFNIAPGVGVSIYLDKDNDAGSKLGQVVTDEKGLARLGIDPSVSTQWDHLPGHTFFAHSEAGKGFDAVQEELTITLARLDLDTVAGGEGRMVSARLLKRDGDSLVPLAGADIRLVVQRLGGKLNIGEEESYTTDSTGSVEAEFRQANLPGDGKGDLRLMALVDDNDEVGSLEVSQTVPWGIVPVTVSDFGNRSLWATANRAPIWLVVMAYGCIISVWSVLIYLVTRLIKLRKLGLREIE